MVTNNAGNIPTAASGKVLQGAGVGTACTFSTPTYPSASGTSGKMLQSDGTNNVYSTPTYPVTAGTSGNILKSDGTNWLSVVPGGALTWTDVTGATQTVVAGNGYLADRGGGVTFTLPASSTIGDVFRIAGVQGSWTLAQAANQQIKFGNAATTVGATGSLASAAANDCVELVASNTSASSVWIVISSIGNITVA